MTTKSQSHLLNFVVFISGAVIMILELTGSRILAPHVGNSLPVWTGLIGIILGSLSIGYVWGGKIADNKPTVAKLSLILFLASITLSVIPMLSKFALPTITALFFDLRIAASIATILLFTLPSILLGMVSPYALRLKLKDIQSSGTTAGNLSAISTIGSIFGTFFAGFFLIAFLGSSTILSVLAVTTFFLSCLLATKYFWKKVILFIIFFGLLSKTDSLASLQFHHPVLEKDTLYNHVSISDITNATPKQTVRELIIGNAHNSAMFLNSNELAYDYTKYYRLVDHFVPNITNALMIGGGGYSYPKDFIRVHPRATLDVVEIDPGVTELAKQYFSFRPNAHTTIFNEDGRTFLNREGRQYDAITIDAFSDYWSPFQLTTQEALKHMSAMLSPQGVIITNTVSTIAGDRGKFLRAEYYTYKSVFPYVAIFPISDPQEDLALQNIMIIAAKKPLKLTDKNKKFQSYLSTIWTGDIPNDVPILTDNYAPVEYFAMKMLQ